MIKKVCNVCGGDDLQFNADVQWDVDTQTYEIASVFDDVFCVDCDETTSVEDKAIPAEEAAFNAWGKGFIERNRG